MTATADLVFVALADPTRRRLLEVLGGGSGCSASTLARRMPVTRQAIGKHLTVLVEAELVGGVRRGREVVYEVHPEQLLVTASWMTSLAATWDQRLALLKARAEE